MKGKRYRNSHLCKDLGNKETYRNLQRLYKFNKETRNMFKLLLSNRKSLIDTSHCRKLCQNFRIKSLKYRKKIKMSTMLRVLLSSQSQTYLSLSSQFCKQRRNYKYETLPTFILISKHIYKTVRALKEAQSLTIIFLQKILIKAQKIQKTKEINSSWKDH